MRRSMLLLLAALVALAIAPLPRQSASASCAAPFLVTSAPFVLTRGEKTSLRGQAFDDGCQDTGSCTVTLGCQSCDYGPSPEPMQDVTLVLVQGERRWRLATSDAESAAEGELGQVTWTFTMPTDVRYGRAKVRATGMAPQKVLIR